MTTSDLARRCIEVYRECRNVDKVCAALGVHQMTVWRALKFGQVALDAGAILTLSATQSGRNVGLEAEMCFQELVPEAESANDLGLNNPGFDFMCRGWRIEIKFCSARADLRNRVSHKWRFQFSRDGQDGPANLRTDFFVAFLSEQPTFRLDSCRIVVIPTELLGDRRAFSWSMHAPTSHWSQFLMTEKELPGFFRGLPDKAAYEAIHAQPDQQLTDFQRRAHETTIGDDDKQLMADLAAEGLTSSEIAEKFSVRHQFVDRVLLAADKIYLRAQQKDA